MPNSLYILWCMEGFDSSGTELVVHTSLHQQADALLHRSRIKAGAAHGFRVLSQRIFNIRGHIVHQPCIQDPFQTLRIAAVGIQFDGIAQRPDLGEEILHPLLEQRLTAAEDHTIQKSPALSKKIQYLRLLPALRLLQAGHQRCIVAKGTAEITAAGEHRGRDLSREIHHSQLLQSAYTHLIFPSLQLYSCLAAVGQTIFTVRLIVPHQPVRGKRKFFLLGEGRIW